MSIRAAATCLTLLLAASSFAQTPKFKLIPGPKPGGGEITWTVDPDGKVEVEKDAYALLEKNVRISYQDIRLAADKVTINLKTRDVTAEGHVVVDQGPSRVTANHAIYNLDSKTGTFFNATATMDPAMYFSGDRIEKVDDDTFTLTNGVFTSCDLDRPAWSFHVGNASVTLDDYARMSDISFRAGGVPIFYTPRLIWPTKRDRAAGFLIPRVLLNSRYGQRVETGYFIPYGDSADATIYADINTEGYFGTGVNVRYLPSENVKIGELTAHAVNNADAGKIEYKYQFRHAQENLPGGFRGVVDVEDFSDLDFFRGYDRDPRLQHLSNIYSSAYLTRNRPGYSLNVLADRRDIVFPASRSRFEQLPSLQFRMYPQRVGRTPLYFQLESSSSRLRTSGIANGIETIGADYFRTDFFPTLSMSLRTPQWISVKPQLSVRETYYSSSLEETTRQPEKESLNRFYAQGQVEVVGPSVSRVFNRSIGGFSRFKHVIEPRMRYVYTTDSDQQDDVIRFDTVDSPFLPLVQDTVEYSLTQRIIGKEAGESGNSREVLSFALRQTVSLSDPFTRDGISTNGRTNKFTPLVASLHVNPYQSITLDANAAFGNVSHQLDQVSLSANLIGTGRMADKYLSLTWFSTLLDPGQTVGGSSNIRINTGSQIIRDRIRADVQLNFDAKNAEFLEQRYLVGWTGSCYGIGVEMRQYQVVTGGRLENDQSFGLAVTLKNVGTVGSH
jgi:lipopolysaccharide assembly outer membrane protein LptD (OstA)